MLHYVSDVSVSLVNPSSLLMQIGDSSCENCLIYDISCVQVYRNKTVRCQDIIFRDIYIGEYPYYIYITFVKPQPLIVTSSVTRFRYTLIGIR